MTLTSYVEKDANRDMSYAVERYKIVRNILCRKLEVRNLMRPKLERKKSLGTKAKRRKLKRDQRDTVYRKDFDGEVMASYLFIWA